MLGIIWALAAERWLRFGATSCGRCSRGVDRARFSLAPGSVSSPLVAAVAAPSKVDWVGELTVGTIVFAAACCLSPKTLSLSRVKLIGVVVFGTLSKAESIVVVELSCEPWILVSEFVVVLLNRSKSLGAR